MGSSWTTARSRSFSAESSVSMIALPPAGDYGLPTRFAPDGVASSRVDRVARIRAQAALTRRSDRVTAGSAAPQTVTVAAGDCAFINGIADGTSVVVAETLASSFRVFSIACNPGCSNIDLNGGTATIPIKRNTDAVLTFTNESTL
jgi:hypothetical protein